MIVGNVGPQGPATRVISGSTLPSTPSVGRIFIKASGGSEGYYYSQSAGVWTLLDTSAHSGTVTSVSGAANQIDVANPTTTPALSFPINGIIANNVSPGFATTATAAGTTTLTVASKGIQAFTGSTTQTIVLPVVTTLPQAGFGFVVQNDSSGVLTVNSSGGNAVKVMPAGTRAIFTCILLTGTDAASWNVTYIVDASNASNISSGSLANARLTNSTASSGSYTNPTITINTKGIITAAANGSAGVTNSAGANVLTKSDGTNLVASQVTDDGSNVSIIGINTFSASVASINGGNNAAQLVLNSTPGVSVMGDVQGNGNGTTLTVDDGAQQVLVAPGGFLVSSYIIPIAAGGGSTGLAVRPYQSMFIGNAANNSSQITSLATGNRVNPVPDLDGTFVLNTSPGSILGSSLTSDYTNATAAFTNTALSATLVAGKTYSFTAQLFMSNSAAADGFGVDFNGGSATATTFIAGSNTSLVTGTSTTLGGVFSNGTLTGTNLLTISGTIIVNAGGTFIVRAKESAHTAGTLSMLTGSSVIFTRLN